MIFYSVMVFHKKSLHFRDKEFQVRAISLLIEDLRHTLLCPFHQEEPLSQSGMDLAKESDQFGFRAVLCSLGPHVSGITLTKNHIARLLF